MNSYLGLMQQTKASEHAGKITKSELEILAILWEHGPSSVRFINDTINDQTRKVQYTSTLKLMQIMVDKNILKKDTSQIKHIYEPVKDEHQIKSHLLQRFVDTLYGGSASRMIMELFGNKRPSKEEFQAINDLLKKYEGKKP